MRDVVGRICERLVRKQLEHAVRITSEIASKLYLSKNGSLSSATLDGSAIE